MMGRSRAREDRKKGIMDRGGDIRKDTEAEKHTVLQPVKRPNGLAPWTLSQLQHACKKKIGLYRVRGPVDSETREGHWEASSSLSLVCEPTTTPTTGLHGKVGVLARGTGGDVSRNAL